MRFTHHFLSLVVFSVLGVATVALSGTSGDEQRFNVLMIISDDLNASVEGFRGHPQTITPNLDRMAAKGFRFTNAHSNNPLCSPSRVSVWSGLHPHRTGYYGHSQGGGAAGFRDFPMLADAVTIFEHFHKNGYEVMGTGKVFHSHRETMGLFKMQDGTRAFGVPVSYGPFPWDGVNNPAATPHPDLKEPWGIGRFAGFETFFPLSNIPVVAPDPDNGIPGHEGWVIGANRRTFRYVSDDDRDLMPDEQSVNWTIRQLQREFDNPFFITVGIVRPHTPFVVPQKYFDRVPLEDIILPPYKEDDLDDVGSYVREMKEVDEWFTRFDRLMEAYPGDLGWRKWIRSYLASVNFVDDMVGQILEALAESRYADNTIVVFTSDHGLHMGQKDLLIKKSPWIESTHIPLLFAGPGVEARGGANDHPVSMIDIYPTLTDLTGLCGDPNRDGNLLPLDGFSLVPFLKDAGFSDWEGPDYVISSIEGGTPPLAGETPPANEQHFSLRTSDWLYVLYRNGEEELYDLVNDPHEWTNLAHDPAHKEILHKLNLQLRRATRMSR